VHQDDIASAFAATGITAVQSWQWPGGILKYLAEARRHGLKTMLRLTGGHRHYTNHAGDFDLAMWKARMERYHNLAPDIQPFIDDGTLAVHMILDDIFNFDGKDPTRADLDEMARFSKEMLPGLPCFARKHLTELPEGGYGYQHLDGAINQWTLRRGDPVAWFDEQAARAAQTGMRIINGLNVTAGGDCSFGFRDPAWPAACAMGPDEIRRVGAAAISVVRDVMPCASYSWRYTADYLEQPGIAEALSDLVAMGASVRAEGCSLPRHPRPREALRSQDPAFRSRRPSRRHPPVERGLGWLTKNVQR
jgi:hypothetical protein